MNRAKVIVANGHPIPEMQEMLDKFRGAKVMSKLYMKSAYHQLELHEESRNLTAFVHEDETWRYKRCCFGLKSLPQCFQKLMETALKGIPGVQVYLGRRPSDRDYPEGARREIRHRHQVEGRQHHAQQRQVSAGVASLEFLGFNMSGSGIRVSAERVQGLRDMGRPQSKKELQAALESLAFYSRFVPNFSERLESLHKQLRKDAPAFLWTEEMEATMEEEVSNPELISASPV